MSSTVRAHIVSWRSKAAVTECIDELAAEEPLEIRIGGEAVSVTMRTPGHDFELVTGMLLTERLIEMDRRPLLRQEHANVINVGELGRAPIKMTRTSAIASSCGLCGKTSVDAVHQHFPPVEDPVRIRQGAFPAMLAALGSAQPGFDRTGGLHAAALFNEAGELLVAREDVGRHNAVDKVIGNMLLRGQLPAGGCTLLVSGRASFEIVQKALGARIPIIAAVSAPSSLAVQLADQSGQTLVGFLRADRFNVYTHPERVAGVP